MQKKHCNIHKKKSRIRTILVLLLLILFSLQVVSLGIAPARKVVGFEPDFKKTFTGLIINNEGKELQLEISKNDPYNLIELDVDLITMNAHEKEKIFRYTINLPNKLEHYGEIARIRVVEKGNSAGISSRLIVEFPIVIEQPKSLLLKNNPSEKIIDNTLPNLENIEKKNTSYLTDLQGKEKNDEKKVIDNKSNALSTMKDKYNSKNISEDSMKMIILLILGLFLLFLLLVIFMRRRDSRF